MIAVSVKRIAEIDFKKNPATPGRKMPINSLRMETVLQSQITLFHNLHNRRLCI